MPIFDLNEQLADMMIAAQSLRRAEDYKTTDTTLSVASENPLAADTDTASEFTYGSVDMRGQQAGEYVVFVPQGNSRVSIFYNPSTREARPIPVAG